MSAAEKLKARQALRKTKEIQNNEIELGNGETEQKFVDLELDVLTLL